MIEKRGLIVSGRTKLGRGLEEDFRKEGPNLKHWLVRDFEREILLAEAFALRENPVETVYHRTLAEMIHKALNDLEPMNGQN